MRITRSPSRSLELFGEEDNRGAAVAADGTDEDGLGPRGGKQGGSRRRPAGVHVGAGGMDVDPN